MVYCIATLVRRGTMNGIVNLCRTEDEPPIELLFKLRTRWGEGIKFIAVAAGNELFGGGMVEEQPIGFRTRTNHDAFQAS